MSFDQPLWLAMAVVYSRLFCMSSNLVYMSLFLLPCPCLFLPQNRDARMSLCATAADRLEGWTWIILREKSVYHTLNTFK